MHEILALFSLWTMFSIDISGFSFYPSYILIPLWILKPKYPKGLNKIILTILPLYLFAIISKPHLIGDLIKLTMMIGYFLYINSFFDRKKLLNIIDLSISIMVLFGLFQYLSLIFGYVDYAIWLHQLVGVRRIWRSL